MVYIYTYIYHKNQPNVGKYYTIHGSYGIEINTNKKTWNVETNGFPSKTI